MYYWGPEDASIHFCEKKYNQVWWAAEFFNTLSSVFYIIVGALFLGSHLDHLGKAVMGVGIGSCDAGSLFSLCQTGEKDPI